MPIDPPQQQNSSISREKFLSILNGISFDAIKSQNLDELYQLLADRLAEIIGADGCYITLWDDVTGTARPGAAYGGLRDSYKQVAVEPGEMTITQTVLDNGKSLVIADVAQTNYVTSRITRQFPAKSMLAIPILLEDQKLGAALFAFNKPHQFLPTEIEYCEQAVRQISPAISNVKHLTALRKSENDHRLAREALQRREAHLSKAQANAKMGSWENDITLGNAVWSDELYRLFDLDPELGVPEDDDLIELVVKQDRKHFKSTLFSAVETGDISPLEFETIHGKRLAGEIYLDTTRKKIMGTFQDVTEQRKLENELSQARKMEVVGTLAGGIAHNFNNILTVIMGNYEILKSSTKPGSLERKVLDQCLGAVDRAAVLTRQLLVVSRKHDVKPTEVDVNALVTDVVGLLRPLIGEHIQVSTNLEDALVAVHADPSHLEQVVMNLMLNARDALDAGGKINILTEIVEKDDDPRVVLIVEDTGTGIDSNNLPHIFEPFYTTKVEGKGTGLGLATVASIVEQSRGKIDVQSKPSEGTRFTLSFPLVRQNPVVRHQNMDEERETDLESNAEDESSDDATSEVVLLIEDHESLRDVACFALEKAGYMVLTAADATEARKIFFGQVEPNLVVTDIQLPGATGIELAQEFREAQPDLPIVFMSGLPENQKHTGVSTFLKKPFRPRELIAAVEQELSSKNCRDS